MLNRPFSLLSLQPKCGGSAAVPVSTVWAVGLRADGAPPGLPSQKVRAPWCPLPGEGGVGDAALRAAGLRALGMWGSAPGGAMQCWGVQIVGMGEAEFTALVSSRSGALCSPGGPQRSVLGMRCWGCRAAGLSQWHRGGSGHLSPSLWPLQPRALTRGRAAAPGLALWWSYSSSVLQNPRAGLCLSTP